MRYLFFDIECCDGAHICEFGYVLTDEHFDVLKKENILINPETTFMLIGRKNGYDLRLTHSDIAYNWEPNFKFYYDKIKEILTADNQIIAGFSTENDAKFLNIACVRNNLPIIKFEYCDVQKAYATQFIGKPCHQRSLENVAKDMGLKVTDKLHESSEDAFLTMQIAKEICTRKNISMQQILDMTRFANFGDFNERLAYICKYPSVLTDSQRQQLVKRVVKIVAPQGEMIESELNGKRICFSSIYEKEFFKDCVVLIQPIVNRGGKICFKASECNYYISHEKDDENDGDPRYHYVKQTQEGTLKVLSFGELLSVLGLDEVKLKELPVPQFKKKEAPIHIEEEHATYSMGDILGNLHITDA